MSTTTTQIANNLSEVAYSAYIRLRQYASLYWGIPMYSEVFVEFVGTGEDGAEATIDASFQYRFMSDIVGFEFDSDLDHWVLAAYNAEGQEYYDLGTDDFDLITDEMLHWGFAALENAGYVLY